MRYLALKLGCCFSSTLYFAITVFFHSAWTSQFNNKITEWIPEVQFMAGEIFSPIPPFTALRPMLFPIPWVLEGLDPWSKVVEA